MNKKSRTDCIYCTDGCEIYHDRPRTCRGFNCAYLQAGLYVELRPDKCGVVFEKVNNNMFHAYIDMRVGINDVGKDQVMAFKSQGYSVVIREYDSYKVLLADGHSLSQIKSELADYSRKKYGSSDIHGRLN